VRAMRAVSLVFGPYPLSDRYTVCVTRGALRADGINVQLSAPINGTYLPIAPIVVAIRRDVSILNDPSPKKTILFR
jgi:hypothetical protein